jgi:hypothetical protein
MADNEEEPPRWLPGREDELGEDMFAVGDLRVSNRRLGEIMD